MRKKASSVNCCSKKGITLVELIVSMTLALLFAVVCVALLNPIERIYQHTVKLSHAQLVADTVVDSIRNACDDVDNSDYASAWIADGTYGETDSGLFSGPGSDANTSGPVLVVRKNGNYCQAIFSCFKITDANIAKVSQTAMTGTSYSHAADSLSTDSDKNNRKSGYVHFGYYQSKDNSKGVTPRYAFDYTNPITASTYDGYTVSLDFANIKYKTDENGVKHPTFVELTVKVYDGDYADVESKRIYTRKTVVSFSANGSGKGTHSGGGTPSTKKDINIRVRWLDESGNLTEWPDNSIAPGIDITFNGTSPARTFTLANGKYQFILSGITVSGTPTLTCTNVTGYTYSYTGKVDTGYVVTYRQLNQKTVKLICGTKFVKAIDQNNVTGVIFGKKSDWIDRINGYKSSGATVTGPTAVAIAYDAQWESSATKDDYVLYKVTQNGKLTSYVLSNDGRFVLNDSCKKMFINCKKLESITGMTGPDPFGSIFSSELTTDMQSMFEGCDKLTSFKLAGLVTSKVTNTSAMFLDCTGALTADLSGWNTSGVTTMKNMFKNCPNLNLHSENWDWDTSSVTDFTYMFNGCDVNADGTFTIDIHTFKFNQSNNIDMSHMFEGCGAKTIIFPESVSTSAGKVTSIEYMFASCSRLEKIDNFLVNADSADAASAAAVNPVVFSGVTKADYVFSKCYGLKNIRLQISLPSCTKITEFFSNCNGLLSADLSKSNLAQATNLQYFFRYCNSMEKVKMNEIVLTQFTGSTQQVFEECYGLRWLEMRDSDLRSVTNAKFITRDSLTYLDLTNADLSGMTSCYQMFYRISPSNIKKLVTVNMTGTKLDSSTSFKDMFLDCVNLQTVIFSPKSSSAVSAINCSEMFKNCSSLTSVDFSGWDKSKVSNISYMFQNCTAFTSFNFNGMTFDTCTNASYLFTGCTGLKTIQMSGFTAPELTNCEGMFSGCTSLDIGVGNLAGWNISKVTNLSYLFKGCTNMGGSTPTSTGEVSFSNMHLDSCTTMQGAFSGCVNIKTLKLNGNTLTKCKTFTDLFAGCSKLTNIEMKTSDLSSMESFGFLKAVKNVDLSGSTFGQTSYGTSTLKDGVIETIDLSGAHFTNCVSLASLFADCKSLKSVNLENLDTSKLENCSKMFSNCYKLETIAASGFDTSKCKNMANMFEECYNVISIDVSGWDTSNVTDMSRMFMNFATNTDNRRTSTEYITLDISGFNFNKLTTCAYMFNTDAKGGYNDFIKTIKLPSVAANAQALNLTNAERMFRKRVHLESIENLGLLATSETLTNTTSMFSETNQLETIDISSMNLSKITVTQYMFNCAKDQTDDRLKTIYVSPDPSFAFASVSNYKNMFDNRKLLTGQNGTSIVGNPTADITYAIIDGYNGHPGYFSVKTQTGG